MNAIDEFFKSNSLQASIERKINQMLDVVSMAHDTGLQWLDGLLKSVSVRWFRVRSFVENFHVIYFSFNSDIYSKRGERFRSIGECAKKGTTERSRQGLSANCRRLGQ